MSINDRILQIIEIKEGAHQAKFAAKLGWTPQYVQKIIKEGESVGLKPVSKILEAYTDIDGRWLVLGEGDMIIQSKLKELKDSLHSRIKNLMEIELYLPYMSEQELDDYRKAADNLTSVNYSEKQLERWQKLSQRHLQH